MVASARRRAAAAKGHVIIEVALPKFLWEFAMSDPRGGSEMVTNLVRKAFYGDQTKKFRRLAERYAAENAALRARVAELENR